MPARSDIQKETSGTHDKVRRKYLRALHQHSKRATILYASAFTSKKVPNLPPWVLSVSIEDIQGFMSSLKGLKGESLDLILHSPGGSLEAAEQIVQYLRSKFNHIRAIVPQNAMSAATMLACASDEILMGKQSALGPIDPQLTLPSANGQFTVAAQSLLDEFNLALQHTSKNPNLVPLWAVKIKDYPPGLLAACQTTITLSIEKVRTWLESYMFKGDASGPAKAEACAKWLGNAPLHKTHGRPLGMQELTAQGLKIIPLEADQKLQDLVLSVFHSTAVTFEQTPCVKLIESHTGKGWFINANA